MSIYFIDQTGSEPRSCSLEEGPQHQPQVRCDSGTMDVSIDVRGSDAVVKMAEVEAVTLKNYSDKEDYFIAKEPSGHFRQLTAVEVQGLSLLQTKPGRWTYDINVRGGVMAPLSLPKGKPPQPTVVTTPPPDQPSTPPLPDFCRNPKKGSDLKKCQAYKVQNPPTRNEASPPVQLPSTLEGGGEEEEETGGAHATAGAQFSVLYNNPQETARIGGRLSANLVFQDPPSAVFALVGSGEAGSETIGVGVDTGVAVDTDGQVTWMTRLPTFYWNIGGSGFTLEAAGFLMTNFDIADVGATAGLGWRGTPESSPEFDRSDITESYQKKANRVLRHAEDLLDETEDLLEKAEGMDSTPERETQLITIQHKIDRLEDFQQTLLGWKRFATVDDERIKLALPGLKSRLEALSRPLPAPAPPPPVLQPPPPPVPEPPSPPETITGPAAEQKAPETVVRASEKIENAWKRVAASLRGVSSSFIKEEDLSQLGTYVERVTNREVIADAASGLQAVVAKNLSIIMEEGKVIRQAHQDSPDNPAIQKAFARFKRVERALRSLPNLLAARVAEIDKETAERAAASAAEAQAEEEARRKANATAEGEVRQAAEAIETAKKKAARTILRREGSLDSDEKAIRQRIREEKATATLDGWARGMAEASEEVGNQKEVIDARVRSFPDNKIIQSYAPLPQQALTLLEQLGREIATAKSELERKETATAADDLAQKQKEATALVNTLAGEVESTRGKLMVPFGDLTPLRLDDALEEKNEPFVRGLVGELETINGRFKTKDLPRLKELEKTGDPLIKGEVAKIEPLSKELTLLLEAAQRRVSRLRPQEEVVDATNPVTQDIKTVSEALRAQYLRSTGNDNPVSTAIQFHQGFSADEKKLKTRLAPLLNALRSKGVGGAIQGIVVVTSDAQPIAPLQKILIEAGIPPRLLFIKMDTSLKQPNTSGPEKDFVYFHFFAAHADTKIDTFKDQKGTTIILGHTRTLHKEWFPQADELDEMKIKASPPPGQF